ncbi:hypothetical protein Back2_17350 [Nocardioides baekrokdamisoli]|uniref:SSD domain-containing protein n=1 Tax=Nocardioides baekrokdamisoli TaxID=1804624 RepID=A0A3G9J1M3_9ACTN|nr:MMPL family transporter [Nocardioides baekrokdamisoli]BBH17448.1 hypothetical protein Back2_17350 [Nocardioides baekrokdamisoli]
MHKFFAWIGEFSVRFRWAIVAFWIAALTGAIFAMINGHSLTSVSQSDNSSFLPDKAPSQHAIKLSEVLQPKNTQSIPIIVANKNGLTAKDNAAIAALIAKVSKIDKVTDAVIAPGGNANAQIINVQVTGIKNGPSSQKDYETLVKALRSSITATENSSVTPHDSGFEAHVIGAIADEVDNAAKSGNNNTQIEIFSFVLILLILFLIYRSILAPFVTLLPAAAVAIIAQPVTAVAAENGLKVSALATILMSVLVLGAGTDYGLFLVFRVREEVEAGRSPRNAVAYSVAKVGESVAFSAGTVIAALLSLLVASFGMYKTLGAPLAIGIVLMLLAGLTLTPALLAILGPSAFWRPRTWKHRLIFLAVGVVAGLLSGVAGAVVPSGWVRTLFSVILGIPAGVALALFVMSLIWWLLDVIGAKIGGRGPKISWGRISAAVVQKPVPVLLVGVVLFSALASFTFGFKASGFGDGASAPTGTDSAVGEALQKQYFQGRTGDQTTVIMVFKQDVWTDGSVIKDAKDALAAHTEAFTSVSSPLDLGAKQLSPAVLPLLKAGTPIPGLTPVVEDSLRKALAHSISADGHTVFFAANLTAGDPSKTAALDATPTIRNAVNAVAGKVGAADSGVIGMSTAVYDISHISSDDLKKVVPIAIVVIGLLLMIVMRSVVAPLYLIVSVGLSYLAALGTAVLVFMTIGGEPGLVFFLPFMMFIFLLALGEDYNILVMTRIREEAHHKPLKEAVRDALSATGTTVTSAGLVLAATFSVFAVVGGSGGGSQIRDLGVGMVVGILMDTFLVRTLLVPSTVILLGKWNWWPSKFSHDHQKEVVVPSGAELAD